MGRHAIDSAERSTRLLRPADGGPVVALNSGAASSFVLVGDHAGRRIPRALGTLGLPRSELTRHIAWDIGVEALGRHLARRLDATFIFQRFSRLVIDCNRDPTRPDAICERSDGTRVSGNAALSADDRSRRIVEIFEPYHRRIAAELDERAARGRRTILVALHSFTPVMAGIPRPWRFGVLHLDDCDFPRAVLDRLRRIEGVGEVGDNEPYRMDGTDFTIPYHAGTRGLDYVELEVRQDLLAQPKGVRAVASDFARLLPAAAGPGREVGSA